MVNMVILLGNIGKDPEVRHLEGGSTVANFSLATSESYKNSNGEKVEKTEWHKIVCWGPQAEFVEMWVRKGCRVYIEGKLTYREYLDKDQNTRNLTEIKANKIEMVTWPADDTKEGGKSKFEAPEQPREDFPGRQSNSGSQKPVQRNLLDDLLP